MFAGKTTKLITDIIAFRKQGYFVVCFKPRLDRRANDLFFSRNGFSVVAKTIASSNEIPQIITQSENNQAKIVNIVCFDETHFFDTEIVLIIKNLLKAQKMVICAGLHQGFSERRLPVMDQLRAIADLEQFLFAQCVVCKLPATKTQRVDQTHQPVNPKLISDEELVGGADVYEPRCDKHFVRFNRWSNF